MLAHVEDTQHIHPHAAGAPWELLALFVVLAITVAVLAVRLPGGTTAQD